MGRFIVIILDSFGIGAMSDVEQTRVQDIGSNTALHIIQGKPDISLETMEKLGLMNAIGSEYKTHRYSKTANWGVSNLAHLGADSFLGHQEIMGTIPKPFLDQPFSEKKDEVRAHLNQLGYGTKVVGEKDKPQILLVNDCVTVGDNLETDGGQVYNVTGCLDEISFEKLKEIGHAVREVVQASRVIVFGGTGVTVNDLLGAFRVKNNRLAGVDAPRSGVYRQGYQVVHLGYGIDPELQIQTILEKAGIAVSLFGKVADVVQTGSNLLTLGVDTGELFKALSRAVVTMPEGFFCLNVQETDIAGHLGDVEYYANQLELCDKEIANLLTHLSHGDICIVTADHGNDPTTIHSNHTRERVPLLIASPGIYGRQIGERSTLADIGATVADYFGVPTTQHGRSFLPHLSGV